MNSISSYLIGMCVCVRTNRIMMNYSRNATFYYSTLMCMLRCFMHLSTTRLLRQDCREQRIRSRSVYNEFGLIFFVFFLLNIFMFIWPERRLEQMRFRRLNCQKVFYKTIPFLIFLPLSRSLTNAFLYCHFLLSSTSKSTC